jgi:hypothetical protein
MVDSSLCVLVNLFLFHYFALCLERQEYTQRTKEYYPGIHVPYKVKIFLYNHLGPITI